MPRALSLTTRPAIRIGFAVTLLHRLVVQFQQLTRDLHRYADQGQRLAKPAEGCKGREASWEGPL